MNILLTGAGFTKNFGGYLANEMWYQVFNKIDGESFPVLKELCKSYASTLDFEGLYNDIVTGNYPLGVKNEIKRVVLEAFKSLDQTIARWLSTEDSHFPISESKLSTFLKQFNPWFTTNQDLFVERQLLNASFFAPLVGDNTLFRADLRRTYEISSNSMLRLDNLVTSDNPLNTGTEFSYIKLHGSFNWKWNGDEDLMVIGKQKDVQISEIPLLKTYFSHFRDTLSNDNNRLLVIGYGFRDEHINDCIIDAIDNRGLKLYVISPAMITTLPDQIERRIEQYFPYSLVDIFPVQGDGLVKRNELKEGLSLESYVAG